MVRSILTSLKLRIAASSAVMGLGLLMAGAVYAAHPSHLACTQPATLNGFITCELHVVRPDPLPAALAAIHIPGHWPGFAAVSSNPPNMTACNADELNGTKRMICNGTPAQGTLTAIAFTLHVVGDCGTTVPINAVVNNVGGAQAGPIFWNVSFPACPAPPPDRIPFGWLDTVTATEITGWVCDASDFNQPVRVHIYDGLPGQGGTAIADVLANGARDAGVATACGGNGAHGFIIPTPAAIKNGAPHTISAFGINIGDGSTNPQLSGSPKQVQFTQTTQCNDGIDNDGDGAIDQNDFSCNGGPTDNDETNPKSACQDGIDNDGDGLVDMNDPGCSSRQDNDETNSGGSSSSSSSSSSSNNQCSDGIDNDGDGATDANDFSCSGPNDNDETNPKSACQDSYDNDGDGLTDINDPGCHTDGNANNPNSYNRQDNDEFNAGGSSSSSSAGGNCRDARDNDGDNKIDANDPDCHTDGNANNPNSYDGSRNETSFNGGNCSDAIDNDSDGKIDAADPDCHTDGNANNPNSFDGSRNETGSNGSSSSKGNNKGFTVTKEASVSEVLPGGIVEYTIEVENDTDRDIHDVIVTDEFDDSDFTVVDDGDADEEDDGKLTWEIGTIDEGDTETIRYRLRVRNSVRPGTRLENDVQVEGDGGAEDDDSITISVIGELPQTGFFGSFLGGGSKNLTPISNNEDGEGMPLGMWLALAAAGLGAGGFLGRKFLL